ncbi:MAG: hypothetical protein VXW65_10730 [Pseudomonadota bacterium]|nr:hypothetical protein [Pseudomonadota bacterium]
MSKRLIQATVLASSLSLLLIGCSQPATPSEAAEQSVSPAPITEVAQPVASSTISVDQTALKAEVSAQVDQYQQAAQALVDQLKSSSDAVALKGAAQALTEQSVPILAGFSTLHPTCAAYLQAAQAVLGKLDSISHQDIEQQYHHDQALPSASAECFHAKDLLVHPATVVVLLRDPSQLSAQREGMITEIDEVIGHIGLVRQSI